MAAPQDLAHYMRPGSLQLGALPPLSLYVHLPWCLKKCPYCDFNSHEMAPADMPEQRYLDALVADLEAALALVWGRTVHSIFIGGGTPSLFSPQAIDRLLADIRARLRLAPDCEITLEANPGTFERNRFQAFRSAGVTRLSVGVQSFNDRHLNCAGPGARQRPGPGSGGGGCPRVRHLQPGPDVCPAGPDHGRAGARHGHGAGTSEPRISRSTT
jgi:coproporphyrinogen III oxidase-like Fe-S oxidoreductase